MTAAFLSFDELTDFHINYLSRGYLENVGPSLGFLGGFYVWVGLALPIVILFLVVFVWFARSVFGQSRGLLAAVISCGVLWVAVLLHEALAESGFPYARARSGKPARGRVRTARRGGIGLRSRVAFGATRRSSRIESPRHRPRSAPGPSWSYGAGNRCRRVDLGAVPGRGSADELGKYRRLDGPVPGRIRRRPDSGVSRHGGFQT